MTKPRKGGKPVYTPATAAARTEGKVTMRLSPDEAAAWRRWAEGHGGLAGLARWLLSQREALENKGLEKKMGGMSNVPCARPS